MGNADPSGAADSPESRRESDSGELVVEAPVSGKPVVRTGDVIAGKYVIDRIIGRGGMGVVAAAQHTRLRKRVALKFLRPDLAHNPEVAARFLREARAAAQMSGEHVARIMDADLLDSGVAYIVMELLEGRDFAAVLKEDGPLPLGEAVDYLLQACEAVAEAHSVKVIHRDLKPANLFLTSNLGEPLVKVLDFGLSKAESSHSSELSTDSQAVGSPHFMSPEQMRSSRDVDARSDIWALGAVLFTFLTGRVPFEGTYLTEICAAVLTGSPPKLSSFRADVPAGLEAVIMCCLRQSRGERYSSVLELVQALVPFAPASGPGRLARVRRMLTPQGSRLSGVDPVEMGGLLEERLAATPASAMPAWRNPTPMTSERPGVIGSSTAAILRRPSGTSPPHLGVRRKLARWVLVALLVIGGAVVTSVAARRGVTTDPPGPRGTAMEPISSSVREPLPETKHLEFSVPTAAPPALQESAAPTSSAPPSPKPKVAGPRPPHRVDTNAAVGKPPAPTRTTGSAPQTEDDLILALPH